MTDPGGAGTGPATFAGIGDEERAEAPAAGVLVRVLAQGLARPTHRTQPLFAGPGTFPAGEKEARLSTLLRAV